jgi:hypothetical protein
MQSVSREIMTTGNEKNKIQFLKIEGSRRPKCQMKTIVIR